MKERKDLVFRLNAFLSEAMRNQRSFSLEFKRQVVEELLSGESRSS